MKNDDKENNELIRHHINPALLLRRFENDKKNIIGIMKYDILFNNILSEHHNKIGNYNSNMFIIERLNFFSDKTIDTINNIILSKNIDSKILEITSLEKSYNYYEDLMGKFLKKYLDNDEKINDIDINIIHGYMEMSELRALKYYDSNYLYPIIDRNPYKQYSNLINIIFNLDDLSNIDSLTLNEKANYINILIHFFKNNNFKFEESDEYVDFFNSLITDFIKIYNLILNNILKVNIAGTYKNKIHFLKSSNSYKFIASDNPVYTIYRNKESNIFDMISDYLFSNGKDVHEITFMVISPQNIVVRSNSEAILRKEIVEDTFIKLLNTLTLYNSDRWIVSQELVFGEKNNLELFNLNLYESIKESDFYNLKTLKLLNIFNYYTDHLHDNLIFDFNITNPLNILVEYIDNPANCNSKIEKIDYTEITGANFVLKLYKKSTQITMYWIPNDYTMKFIQHLDCSNTYSIKYLIRAALSKKLNYTPIDDELQFFKYDKDGIIREVHFLKDYAYSKKNKKLDGLVYSWLYPIEYKKE